MSKRCARCEKVVYPIEELKCLDKIWHKGCFKCKECSMTLSMKTYKGFNKFPYCEAHIPKAKATTVAETPETKRLAENTKIQSNVQYHADFEKNKARFTQVADDPETLRLKQNTKNISNIAYHGDIEKRAKMELKRDTDGNEVSPEQPPPEEIIAEPAPAQVHQYVPPQMSQRPTQPTQYTSVPNTNKQPKQQHTRTQQPPRNNQYYQGHPNNYHPQYQQQVMTPPQTQYHQQPPLPQQYQQQYNNVPQNYAYQDSNRNATAPYRSRSSSQTLIYTSQAGPVNEVGENVGSISDYDPLNNQYGSISAHGRHQPTYRQEPNKQGQRGQSHREGQQMTGHGQHMGQHAHQKITAPPTNLGQRCYRAIYDYEAADSDEVSFKDGDLIVNCTSIDEGWMTGTVQRSGRVGMLPANYVERVS